MDRATTKSIERAEKALVDTTITQVNRDTRLIGEGIAMALGGTIYRALMATVGTYKRSGIPADDWVGEFNQWRVIFDWAISKAEEESIGKTPAE